MANMQGKTVLVTGATNGIGKVTALELAKMGAQVVVAGRSRAKTEATVSDIRAKSGNPQVEMLLADLSVMAQVRQLAADFQQRFTRLDVLVNNAGAYFAKRQMTNDGYEMTFALNHLAYFLLTNLLLDVVKASAPARIVNVSSDAHRMGGAFDFDNVQGQRYGWMGFQAYSQSKLANVLFTYELARRLAGTGVTVNAVHPGSVATGFAHNNTGFMNQIYKLVDRFSLTPEQGAETLIYLASSPEVEGVTGKYFYKCKAVRSSPASYDEAAQQRLWVLSEEMVGREMKKA